MPPKAKFTREEIVDAAFSMVRESGMGSLTARELSKRLGSSARPIFTVFNSMDEVKEAVVQRAVGLALEYIRRGLKSEIPSKGVGMSYIQFAMDEPQLFRLLFMMPSKESRTVLSMIDQFNGLFQMSDLIVGSYGIDKEQATRVFQNIWIYTHGIATMIVNRLCSYTEEEISDRLTEVFWALIEREKAGHRGRSFRIIILVNIWLITIRLHTYSKIEGTLHPFCRRRTSEKPSKGFNLTLSAQTQNN